MKTLWCWRCQQDMPMLDEAEFASVDRLYSAALRPGGVGSIDARFEPVRREYERLTGFASCHQNAVMHHRLSLLGPPCASCGKPLRTPQARHCAECGVDRHSKFRIGFSPPAHGWIQLALHSDEQSLSVLISYTPFDSLEELARALLVFLETGRRTVARINSEPDTFSVVFESGARARSLRLEVRSTQRVFIHEGDVAHVARAVWRSFRKLETQFVPEEWLHAFPKKLVEQLALRLDSDRQ